MSYENKKPNALNVGVIGLGNMGRGVAKNLIKAGNNVLIWDIDDKAYEFFDKDIETVKPKDMAGRCSIIIFVVPGSIEIDSMLKGKGSILQSPKRGLILYDFTTSDPAYTQRLARRAASKGVAYMDVGMTGGGAKGADDGTMTLMIGGELKIFEKTKHVLSSVAAKLIYLGKSGAGHTMKIIHNLITHTNFFALCEAAHLGRRAGIELQELIEVFNNGNARSFISERRFPDHILSDTWDARSKVFNLHKDLGMAIGLAEKLGATVNIGRKTFAYLEEAMDQGRSEDDFSRLYLELDNLYSGKSKKTRGSRKINRS